ncbi:AbrB/MazE/SpoVT family DNA-binding domain-containing protein [Brochothrix thermosphacta]|uniref:AbrB/MazE/SpoVT family DNA-binding domain-containing protein n=1 Tax=Brochothrix thermosphacta TaxID=2756 RepID=UPI00271397A8|nr:AbrB/MazE/SpoVT family DNA-binding domain-containing protein [Brochothrix thermosphacta]MDO7864902.1 AbrB/MazE/SpoVT family DNA-binding domain-containing protein [Brochothrix thermosphacta]
MVMKQLQVKTWGNSQAVRLPKNMLKELNIKNNDILDIAVKNGAIIIKKPKEKKELTINDLFANYDGTKFQTEIQDIEPIGNELW